MCYENIISIRGLCQQDNAMYYLDDIGISLLMAAKTADEKYGTGKKLIEAKIKQAWRDAFNDITFHGLEANKVLNDVTAGSISVASVAPFDAFRGVKFTMDKDCILSRFFLHKVTLSVKIGGATKIVLRDSGIEYEIYNGTIGNDEIIEVVTNRYMSDSFQILADNKEIEVYSSLPNITCNCRDRLHFTINGTSYTSELYGITADIQVRCDKDKYLCKFVDKIGQAVLYKAAALIWKDVNDSSRLNDYLVIKKEDAIAEMAWLDSTYNLLKYDPAVENNYTPKGMYQKELEKLNIPVPKCPCCMECKSDGYTMVLP